MTSHDPTFVVLAKRPVPGRVKTRLSPPFTATEAADLAGAALRDTLDVVAELPAARRLLAFDGDPDGWLPAGWTHVAQVDGSLDRRIAAALEASEEPTVLVGMDTPQLSALDFAELNLTDFDASLGLATDGGYWALGLARPEIAEFVVHDIPMSRPDTGERQLHRLTQLGLRVQLLPEQTDIDTAESAATVADLVPDSRFARTFRTLAALPAERG